MVNIYLQENGIMKREEKNQQTRRRILESALAEFAEQGYGASSVNTISNGEGPVSYTHLDVYKRQPTTPHRWKLLKKRMAAAANDMLSLIHI